MNLKYLNTVYGERVRIDIDSLDKGRPFIPTYDKFGKKISREKRLMVIHLDNLIME